MVRSHTKCPTEAVSIILEYFLRLNNLELVSYEEKVQFAYVTVTGTKYEVRPKVSPELRDGVEL